MAAEILQPTRTEPDRAAMVRMIRQNEGFRPTTYRDTVGKRTIGIGFNLDDPTTAQMLPQDVVSGARPLALQEAETIFQNKRLPVAMSDATNFMGSEAFQALDPVRQGVLVDLAYNMGGPSLAGFKKMKAALLAGDYASASNELLSSKYARQLPNRAKRNALMLLTGKLSE